MICPELQRGAALELLEAVRRDLHGRPGVGVDRLQGVQLLAVVHGDRSCADGESELGDGRSVLLQAPQPHHPDFAAELVLRLFRHFTEHRGQPF